MRSSLALGWSGSLRLQDLLWCYSWPGAWVHRSAPRAWIHRGHLGSWGQRNHLELWEPADTGLGWEHGFVAAVLSLVQAWCWGLLWSWVLTPWQRHREGVCPPLNCLGLGLGVTGVMWHLSFLPSSVHLWCNPHLKFLPLIMLFCVWIVVQMDVSGRGWVLEISALLSCCYSLWSIFVF